MDQGICALSNIPVRKEPGSRSEMVNMLLFGETFEVSAIQGEWLAIVSSYDGYSGWINQRQFTPLLQPLESPIVTTQFPFLFAQHDGQFHMLLPGSEISHLKDKKYQINDIILQINEPLDNSKRSMIQTAKLFLNTPYLWGGRSPFGIDCSGFTQIVFKMQGIRLRRDAWQQAEQGEIVAFRESVIPGDLAFFDNDEGRIIHTGIMLDPDHIIHASGKVRIDRLDQFGIYDAERKEYSHKLRIIKRLNHSIVK